MRNFLLITLFIFIANCTINFPESYREKPSDKDLENAELIGKLKITAEQSGANFANALQQMLETDYISEREFFTISDNIKKGKKVTNKLFVGLVCDLNKFPTRKERSFCFNSILVYLRDDADEVLCTLQEKLYDGSDFVCY
tara:strand:+ start:179 stop:601 length:423 start_codon:yes stop_codon:yes gene_type:complete